MPQPPRIPTTAYSTSEQRRANVAWWGVGSIAAGAMAAAFLPAAWLGGGAGDIDSTTPLWSVLCIVGIVTGIRGMQRQKRAPKLQRVTAVIGTLLSLAAFVTLVVVALAARQ